MEGWVKSYRKIMDNPIVCKDSDHYAVWGYLLHMASYQERDFVFGGEKIVLQKGQLITGRKIISDKFHIHESKVQRILKTFEIDQQIKQQTNHQNRLITILNWEQYQEDEQQIEQPVNNERTTDEQRMNTYKKERKKEGKKERKEKENLSTDGLFFGIECGESLRKALESFIEMRNSKGSPFTQNGFNLMFNKLQRLSPKEDEQILIINESIMSGWLGIFPLKQESINHNVSRYREE